MVFGVDSVFFACHGFFSRSCFRWIFNDCQVYQQSARWATTTASRGAGSMVGSWDGFHADREFPSGQTFTEGRMQVFELGGVGETEVAEQADIGEESGWETHEWGSACGGICICFFWQFRPECQIYEPSACWATPTASWDTRSVVERGNGFHESKEFPSGQAFSERRLQVFESDCLGQQTGLGEELGGETHGWDQACGGICICFFWQFWRDPRCGQEVRASAPCGFDTKGARRTAELVAERIGCFVAENYERWEAFSGGRLPVLGPTNWR